MEGYVGRCVGGQVEGSMEGCGRAGGRVRRGRAAQGWVLRRRQQCALVVSGGSLLQDFRVFGFQKPFLGFGED